VRCVVQNLTFLRAPHFEHRSRAAIFTSRVSQPNIFANTCGVQLRWWPHCVQVTCAFWRTDGGDRLEPITALPRGQEAKRAC
jgi:hypothetical protein